MMYGWMWSNLPGPTPVRILITVLLAFLVVAVLYLWVFPVVDEKLQIDDSQISSAGVNRTHLH